MTDAFWKNVEIFDATEPLQIYPNARDLKNAVQRDPEGCIYANCLKRVFKVRRVRIWRTIALVEGHNSEGETVAFRYNISAPGKKALMQFDSGVGTIVPCLLNPPSTSTKLNSKRSVQKRLRKNRWNEWQERKKSGLVKPKAKPEDGELVRSGTGHHKYSG